MQTYYGRKLDEPELGVQSIQLEDDEAECEAGAALMHRHSTSLRPGDTLFLEVSRTQEGPWSLWRCQCLPTIGGRTIIRSEAITPEAARNEIAKAVKRFN